MEKIKYYNETKLNQEELVSLLSEQTLPAKKMIISISSILILFIILLLNWDKENPSMYILLTVLLTIGLIGLILGLLICRRNNYEMKTFVRGWLLTILIIVFLIVLILAGLLLSSGLLSFVKCPLTKTKMK